MKTKQELIDARAKAWETAKDFLNTHANEKGMLSGADKEAYDKMEADIKDYTDAINRAERAEALENELGKPTSQPMVSKPMAGMPEDESGKPITSRDAYRKACVQAVRTKLQRVQDVMEEGTDSAGGYLVPEEWDKRILDILHEENIMRPLATVIKTSGDHHINVSDGDPEAKWIDEGAAIDPTDAAYDQITLEAHKLHVAVKVTEELLYDNAYDLESSLLKKMGRALGNAEEAAFLTGNGTKKPTGIFDLAGGGTLAIGLDEAAGFSADKLIDLVYSLKKPYRKKAKFILNDKSIALIRKFKDQNGAYIWQPSYQAGEPDRVLGYPVFTSAYAPEIAAEAPEANAPFIAFGDFSYYNIGDRGQRSFQTLKELYAGNGMVGYVLKQRVDGKLGIKEAVQLMYVKPEAPTP